MRERKVPAGVHEALVRTKWIFFTGMVVLLAGLIVLTVVTFGVLKLTGVVLAAGGVVLLFQGWGYGREYCVCPHCGHSLYVSGVRIPDKIPNYCPHCGEGL